MDDQKQRLSIEAARLYYLCDYSQKDIAAKLGVSRPTVSRLLKNAKERDYVQIDIVDQFEDLDTLAHHLKRKYRLDTVHVCYSPRNEYQEIQKRISRKAAEYLAETVQDSDIIGVAWGTTINSVAHYLQSKQVKDVEVVQLKGGVSHSHVNTYATQAVNLFAKAFDASARYLPLPVVFDNVFAKEMVEKDSHIQRIIQLGKQANIAIFTAGAVQEDSLLFRLGYFNKNEQESLLQTAVGDICSRFFDEQGNICSEEINKRTVGIDLSDLGKKEKAILVAGGQRKIEAVRAALLGEHANILITDQYTAKALIS